MKRLTAKEEEVMGYFWEKGPLFVRELLSFYDEPKPHFNTLSTVVRGLEEKGFVGHKVYGNTYQYYATVSRDDYRRGTFARCHQQVFRQFLPLGVVSSLVQEEKISVDDLKELIKQVEEGRR